MGINSIVRLLKIENLLLCLCLKFLFEDVHLNSYKNTDSICTSSIIFRFLKLLMLHMDMDSQTVAMINDHLSD